MFFCIPIIFGCQTTLKPEGAQQAPSICPHCHNASLFYAKSTTWFELFWIPLVPLSRKHIWACPICQWKAAAAPGQPQGGPGARGGYPVAAQGYHESYQPGYAPAYPIQGSTK